MNQSELTKTTRVLADQAIRTVRAGDLRAALGLARHALRMSRDEGASSHLHALNALGLVQSGCGLFIESIASCIDAFELAQRIEDREAALHAAITAAGAGTFIIEPGPVLECLLEHCTAEARRLNDDALLTRIGNTFGLQYAATGRFDDAFASYENALAHIGAPDSPAALYTPRYLVMGNLAYAHVQKVKSMKNDTADSAIAEARYRIECVLAIALEVRNVDAEARARFGMGMLLAHLGEHDAAIDSLEQTIAIARTIQHPPRLIDSMIELSRSQRAMGDGTAAIATLDDAYALAQAQRPTARLAMICDELAVACEAIERPREAAHHRDKAERERAAHAVENEHARRELTNFWQRLAGSGE
jgi:tetratricopeptide (TPR) repeat protein